MDIYKAIDELKSEKDRIDRAIAALEAGHAERPRRGGRSWNGDARRAAAERMKKYWEQRRRQKSAEPPPGDHNESPPSTDSA